jgi:histidine ammonia-lyase
MQESHVLVGWNVARKLRLSVLKMQRILAIELLAAAWRSGLVAFLDLHEPNCLDQ